MRAPPPSDTGSPTRERRGPRRRIESAVRGVRSRLTERDRLLQHLIIDQLVTVAGAFLINVLSARAMGPANRGEIALILQLSYLAGAVVPLGRDRAALRAEFDPGATARIRGAMAELARTPIGILLAAGLVFGLWRFLLDGSIVVMVGFVLLLAGDLASRFFRVTAILERNATGYLTCTALGQISLVLAGGALLVGGISAVTPWLLVYGAALALPFLVALVFHAVRRPVAMRDAGAGPDLHRTKRLALGLLPSTLLTMAMTKADKLLLPVFSSFATLGYYTVAVSLVNFSLLPFTQYIDSRIPRWTELYRQGRLRLHVILLRPLATAVVVIAMVAVAAYWAIPLVFGQEYLPARAVIPWLAVAALCQVASNFCAGLSVAIEAPKVFFRMRVVGIGVLIPMLVVLIPMWGASGAAIAQALGFGVSGLLGVLLVHRAAGSSPSKEVP